MRAAKIKCHSIEKLSCSNLTCVEYHQKCCQYFTMKKGFDRCMHEKEKIQSNTKQMGRTGQKID